MIVIGIDPSISCTGVSDGAHHAVVKTSPGPEDVDAMDDLSRRSGEIIDGLAAFIDTHHRGEDVALSIEAPMLTALGGGSNHLFEMGFLFHDLLFLLPSEVHAHIFRTFRVPTSTVRKWAVGKGNIAKDDMKLKVFQKFGVEFDADPGADKLFAFLLAKFGAGVIAGEVEFTGGKRRGSGARAKAAIKKAKRTRGVAA